jgi:transcriptional regulator with AAA-type ATPase domain/DNA-binding winged helix-turn-helix (wHTH) protein
VIARGCSLLVRVADLELDQSRFELRRAGQPVLVQPKVLDLIFYLVRHRERVITRDELMDRVWAGVIVSDGSLSQAVSLARKALGDDPQAQRFIRTVRMRGFRFVGPVEEAAGAAPPARPAAGPRAEPFAPGVTSVSLSLDTASATDGAGGTSLTRRHLYVLLHCDDPRLGGARHDLDDVDEVEIGRGRERSARRVAEAVTRRLVVTIPGEAVSRQHARLVRTARAWCVVDAGSKNGTFVNGARAERQVLRDGDVVECGRTLFLLRETPATPPELRPDVELGAADDDLGSLVPGLQGRQHLVERVARTGVPILLVGETGSGKEVAARAFHRRSDRPGPFVVVSAAALTAGHGVQQLFGTDAGPAGAGAGGILDRAEGGTLLLDQIEALPEDAQAALVRALDDRAVLRVGAAHPAPVDVRVMAATTAELAGLVAGGRFRGDLLARLAAFEYRLPPLRERRGDLGVLVARLLAGLGAPGASFTPAAALALARHPFPGNLRELRGCLEEALARAGGARIEPSHLPAALAEQASQGEVEREP